MDGDTYARLEGCQRGIL